MRIEMTDTGARVIHNNGRIERCESLAEAREVCHVFGEIMRTLRPTPARSRSVPHGHITRHGGIERKRVIITLDNDPEIIKDRA